MRPPNRHAIRRPEILLAKGLQAWILQAKTPARKKFRSGAVNLWRK
jgi:hypothetical protein